VDAFQVAVRALVAQLPQLVHDVIEVARADAGGRQITSQLVGIALPVAELPRGLAWVERAEPGGRRFVAVARAARVRSGGVAGVGAALLALLSLLTLSTLAVLSLLSLLALLPLLALLLALALLASLALLALLALLSLLPLLLALALLTLLALLPLLP